MAKINSNGEKQCCAHKAYRSNTKSKESSKYSDARVRHTKSACVSCSALQQSRTTQTWHFAVLDFISSPSAICSPAPYMKSTGPKSAVCSPNRKAVPVTSAVTSHTVQIPHIGSHIPASNTYAWSQWPIRKSDARHFPCINIDGRKRTYPVVHTSGNKVSVSIMPRLATIA